MLELAISKGASSQSMEQWEPSRCGRIRQGGNIDSWINLGLEDGKPKFYRNGKSIKPPQGYLSRLKGKAPILIGLAAVGTIGYLLANNLSSDKNDSARYA